MLKFHKANSLCRVCNHQFNTHCIYVNVLQGDLIQPFIQPLEIVPCDSYMHSNSIGKCGCINWEPVDNLEYLELKAKQADEKTSN